MRAYTPDFELKTPRDLREVLETLARAPAEWRPFAGGTDLMVQFEAGTLAHHRFLNLWGLKELKGVRVEEDYVFLGALETYAEIREHEALAREFPLLGRAAQETGAIAIQNRGTLGGNIANASPAADTPPALLAYDAEVCLLSLRGQRWLPYSDFHVAYKQTQARPDEIISQVRLPRLPAGIRHQFYRKVGTRRAQAISKVCLAVRLDLDARGVIQLARVALGSVCPVPFRARATEKVLEGMPLHESQIAHAQNALRAEIKPIDDIRSTAEYRSWVAPRILGEFLSGLTGISGRG